MNSEQAHDETASNLGRHALAALIGAVLVVASLLAIPALAGADDTQTAPDTTADAEPDSTGDVDDSADDRSADETGETKHRHGLHRKGASGVFTDLLDLSRDELRAELRNGSTLADVAEANGVDRSVLVDALTEAAESRITAALEAGKLTDAEANEMTAGLTNRIEARLDRVRGDDTDRGSMRGHGKRGHRNHSSNNTETGTA